MELKRSDLISLQYGTSLITVWDISHYSMIHTSIQHGAFLRTVWDLSLQYGTSLITVWDISGGRRSPAVACWANDHWVASLNPLRGKFRH